MNIQMKTMMLIAAAFALSGCGGGSVVAPIVEPASTPAPYVEKPATVYLESVCASFNAVECRSIPRIDHAEGRNWERSGFTILHAGTSRHPIHYAVSDESTSFTDAVAVVYGMAAHPRQIRPHWDNSRSIGLSGRALIRPENGVAVEGYPDIQVVEGRVTVSYGHLSSKVRITIRFGYGGTDFCCFDGTDIAEVNDDGSFDFDMRGNYDSSQSLSGGGQFFQPLAERIGGAFKGELKGVKFIGSFAGGRSSDSSSW